MLTCVIVGLPNPTTTFDIPYTSASTSGLLVFSSVKWDANLHPGPLVEDGASAVDLIFNDTTPTLVNVDELMKMLILSANIDSCAE